MDRKPARTTIVPERRPIDARAIKRAAQPSPSPARVLQQRLGNQGAQALVSSVQSAPQIAAAGAQQGPVVVANKAAVPAQSPILAPATEKIEQKQAEPKGPAAGTRATTATGPDTAAARVGGAEGKAAEAKASVPSARDEIAPAIAAVRHRAAGARKHSAKNAPGAAAQAAAISPQVERDRADARQTVSTFDSAKTEEVKKDDFKAALHAAIDKSMEPPKTEAAANEVMANGAKKASAALQGSLKTEQDKAAGPMTTALGADVKPTPTNANAVSLQVEPFGPAPAPISANPVVPSPLPPEKLDYSSDRGSTDQVMAENNVTQEQLEQGNEPAFGPAIAARSSAEKHEAAAEAKYRQGESKVQNQAQVAAVVALAKGLTGLQGIREERIGNVIAQQRGTQSKDALERQRVTDAITGIKNRTKTDVEKTLTSMESEASAIFDAGLRRAEQSYKRAFDDAKGGLGSWLTKWGDRWTRHIEAALTTARSVYLQEVSKAIDDVATLVDSKLVAAKQLITNGMKQVETFVDGLTGSVKQFGEEALQTVSADFDAMRGEVDQRRDGLIDKLTEQHKESFGRMTAMEEKLREANKSLWQRVYDATVGLVKKIIAFKNMLLGALGKAASVIGDIIAHPIRFLGNLVSAVKLGLQNFIANIGTHLQKGLMDWLFGALSGAGLTLPEKFDLQGIISIVLQILGLTYANFRSRAVRIVGEPVVAAIEKTAEVFKILTTEGVSGLWRLLKEQLANLKSMVLDGIFNYVKDKVISAGIKWIVGLMNPASAFIKACMAIYDIVMFFINRGKQIMALVNAVLDSMAAIAKGSIGSAAAFVENALAKAIPVAIGFLASLLGLGDPSKQVRELIEKAQAPVNKAIDWVINLAVKGVKALGKIVGGAFGKKDMPDARTDQERSLILRKP